MKTILKIVVIVAMVANTGIFYEMMRASSESDKASKDPRVAQQVRNFCEAKYQKAKVNKNYSPYDYFRDLGDVWALEDSLNAPSGVFFDGRLNDLQALSIASIRSGKYSYDDVEKARAMLKTRPDLSRHEFFDEVHHTPSSKISALIEKWAFSLYLKNIIPATMLLLLWLWSDDKKRIELKNPFSFIFSAIFYPVFFIVVFVRWVKLLEKSFSAEVELRKTKEKFFCILSQDEIAAIQKFVQSNEHIKVWRQELKEAGYTAKRSYAVAFLATVVCIFIYAGSSLAHGQQHEDVSHSKAKIVLVHVHASSGGISQSHQQIPHTYTGDSAAIVQDIKFAIKQSFQKFYWYVTILKLVEVFQKIEHIPVFRLVYSFLINNVLTNKKEIGNESNNHYIVFVMCSI